MTLTDFLLARIDEAEAMAQRVIPGLGASGEIQIALHTTETLSDGTKRIYTDYVAPYDPARVLAECEAKRQIVEYVTGWGHITVEDCWYSCAATYDTDVENACCRDTDGKCDCGLDYRVAHILGPLTLPYRDHPDYRQEWRL